MLELQTIVMFVTASTLLALAPGPDILFVLTQSMSKGSRSGIVIALGLCSGLIFHTTAVALGVAVIFQTSALAFSLLKFVGAAYLLYLAFMAFKDASKSKLESSKSRLSLISLYKRGILMNITNPKVSIFFLAFLPQFTNPEVGNVTGQIFTLGALFMLCAFVVFTLISLLAGRVGAWFSKTKNGEKILNRVSGTIFAALAVKLAFTSK
ncbi:MULTISPECIES: LysE family translocator [Sulfurospirillum]|uniref:RhtB family transporter n=3 Tax=Sulfurospirillum TaxID=57665 RepID=A0A1D7TIP1_9BACT|nr:MULTISPECIES: LysE family translocator [Sulfurospirillum]AHJ12298.1 RhtB family transporter [Sulfurospirillum multivorans DSM 12446]AOO64857.1 RhtB family transporter [Sulfurospirillum halorespirans DSM 13726]QEH05798.1 RhtB family transporter [Sulfurospirillum multivorans]